MPRGQGHTRGQGPTWRYVDLFGSWSPLPGPHVRPLRQLRTARPRRATQGKARAPRPCQWFPVAALDVLRMTPQEQGEWSDMVARLEVPLIGPTGAAAGSVDLSRLRSLYTPPDGGAPYYLHPELVDETTGAPMCLLCNRCGASVTGGKRPPTGSRCRGLWGVGPCARPSGARVPGGRGGKPPDSRRCEGRTHPRASGSLFIGGRPPCASPGVKFVPTKT